MERYDVVIVGGGPAGLSAAIYLGRGQRSTLVMDSGKSMARWEPDVQNYLGFPKGIDGKELVRRGVAQAKRYGVKLVRGTATSISKDESGFTIETGRRSFACRRVLLATGIFHLPPKIPGVEPCLGHSMFFCKDCDGYKVHGRHIAIYGWNDDAVEYALAMLAYSPCVWIVTDGHDPKWSHQHSRWAEENRIPVYTAKILKVRRRGSQLQSLTLADGCELDARVLFTTRGDVYYNTLARKLGARLDSEGEVVTDEKCRTSVPGLYAAGCVTPANCQIVIAAGQGATAAQAINRDLFEESLVTHRLMRYREKQLKRHRTRPRMKTGVRLAHQHAVEEVAGTGSKRGQNRARNGGH